MTGKYRFLYIFVVIAICMSISVVFSEKVKAAEGDDTVVQSESGTTDGDALATDKDEEDAGKKDKPPGMDKGEKKGFEEGGPRGNASPSE